MELTRLIIENSEIKDYKFKKKINAIPVGNPVAIETPASGNLDFGDLFHDIPDYAKKIGGEIKPNAYVLGSSSDVYVTPVDQFDRGLRSRIFPVQFYIIQP